jgi:hypothetical protein
MNERALAQAQRQDQAFGSTCSMRRVVAEHGR